MSLESSDCIHIQGLELPVRIGVPEEERAGWQTLQADLTLRLHDRFEAMQDDLTKTVDYSAVAVDLRTLAAARPRGRGAGGAGDFAAHGRRGL
jgi:dihydroneopterin aldolase